MSGTLADRPALAEALVLLREGKAQGLVVHRLDRLAGDLVLQARRRRAGGTLWVSVESRGVS